MRVTLAIRTGPKRGNEEVGSDDACWPETSRLRHLHPGDILRVAIADGASGSVCSGMWARLLASNFSKGYLTHEHLPQVVASLSAIWRQRSDEALKRQHGGGLPWYLEEKMAAPAQAALLGLTVEWPRTADPRWTAYAVGDACLFHCEADKVIQMFPISSVGGFGNEPLLIPAGDLPPTLTEAPLCSNGILSKGDRIYLMTDALAAWFMADYASQGVISDSLETVLDGERELFIPWVNDLRDSTALKNDDVTVMRLTFD